jgi:hypothetical protein
MNGLRFTNSRVSLCDQSLGIAAYAVNIENYRLNIFRRGQRSMISNNSYVQCRIV